MLVPPQRLAAASAAELGELAAAIEAELTRRALAGQAVTGGRAVVEERPAPGGCYRLEFVRCGKCGRCAEGPAHGPYWYLYTRRGGRLTSRYIGKQLPAVGAAPGPARPAG
jgi:hypothetical protein